MKALKDMKALEEVSKLKAELRALNRKLDGAKSKRDELATVLREAVKECLLEYEVPTLSPPPEDKRQKTAEVAICVLSDFQLGKRTPSYNSQVCEKRVARYVRKVRRLIAKHRAQAPVQEVRVYLLGDIVESENIFPGQPHLIDASLYRQLFEGASIVSRAVCELAQEGSVVVRSVIGNHGRIGKRGEYHPETNADAILYEVARLMSGNAKRITWHPAFVSGERAWFAMDDIGKKRAMLFHGDQVRGGFAGIPFYGFNKKLLGWSQMQAMMEKERFDYAFCGHWHTPTRIFLNGITCWVNGSTESHNTYAAEQLAAAGRPSQWLMFCHPERGITAEYLVHLDEE